MHPSHDMLDRPHHVALKIRIVAVALGVRKQELQLSNQVFQVMHDEGRHAVEGVEFLRFQQRLGGLRIGQVAGGLAACRLQQVEDLPVEVDLDARVAEHDEADQLLPCQQRNDQPGIAQRSRTGGSASLLVVRGCLHDVGDIEHPARPLKEARQWSVVRRAAARSAGKSERSTWR